MRPSCLRGAAHSCTQGRMMFSSWMLWGFLSHQLHKKGHFEWCLWELIIVKNKRNKRCAIGITCRWVLVGQLFLRRSVVAAWIWLGIILRRRQTFEREGQNATKITSVLHRLVHSISLASDVDFDENIVSVSGSLEPFAPPSSNFATLAVMKPRRVETEEYYFEALAFSRRSINLELDEENMMPAKSVMTSRSSGINPSTMKMKRGTRNKIAQAI